MYSGLVHDYYVSLVTCESYMSSEEHTPRKLIKTSSIETCLKQEGS